MTDIVILFSPGPFGGAEQVILNSVKELKAKLWLIQEERNPSPCLEFQTRCVENNIIFEVISCQSRFDIKTLINLKKKIKEQHIQLIHSHGMKANFYNALLPVKRIATQHGKTSHNKKVRILERIEHQALKRMDKVICVSQSMYKEFQLNNKVLIENYLSHDFSKTNHKISKEIHLLAIGRLSPEKGFADAIQAIMQTDHARLSIIGDGQELSQLKKLANNDSRIHFEGFQKCLDPFFEKADALIMPSYREGLPMTLIEATAAALPVLASCVGGIPSLLKESELLFNPGAIKEIVDKIKLFQKKQDHFNNKAISLSKEIKNHYSQAKWLEKMKSLYQSL